MSEQILPVVEDFNQDRQAGLRPGVVICVINKELKILLGLKEEYQIWEIPQGGIGEDENLISALKREIAEELGESFLHSLFIPEKPLVATDKIVFPEQSLKGQTLKAGEQDILMVGKKYYICLVVQKENVEPDKIEYGDFRWVSFSEGMKIVETIPQKGKKRVLRKILEILKEGGLIK
jgi:8-oxo-dGTP pyrophosphatase MutT (NUDIX family)